MIVPEIDPDDRIFSLTAPSQKSTTPKVSVPDTPSFTAAIPKGGVTGFVDVSSSADDLMSAINQQPVSVAIEADQSAFRSHSGGIPSEGCGTNSDHGVLAVGYDIADGYYLVKNSWGSSWEDNSYLKISTTGNVCGTHGIPSERRVLLV